MYIWDVLGLKIMENYMKQKVETEWELSSCRGHKRLRRLHGKAVTVLLGMVEPNTLPM